MSDLLQGLACPRCDRTPLEQSEHGYRCAACNIDFPLLDGIAWMFAEPGAALGEWRGRLHGSLRQLEQRSGALLRPGRMPRHRERAGSRRATAHDG